jgi:hypothetical protein
MEDRKVVYYEYKKAEKADHFEKVCAGNALFLDFGVDFEEFEYGVGTYSTAIIELPSGEVKNVPVELIVFNN